MPRLPLEFTALVDTDGTLVDGRGAGVTLDLKEYVGKTIRITAEVYKPIRSKKQNSYYWAEVIPKVRKGLEDYGYQLSEKGVESWFIDYILTAAATDNTAHAYMKKCFLEIAWTKKKDDEQDELSTKDLDTEDFKKYFELIIKFAAEHLNMQIMYPGEQSRMSLNDRNKIS